jgi:hypothetical protein
MYHVRKVVSPPPSVLANIVAGSTCKDGGNEEITPLLLNTGGNTHCKKKLAIYPSPAGMSLTKLSLAGNSLIIPGQGEFGKSGNGKTANLFIQCSQAMPFILQADTV